MDEPLFLEHERAYFGRIYLKVREKRPLDSHEAAFLISLVIRSQKNCLVARIERDQKDFHPPKTIVEATEAVKNHYTLHGYKVKTDRRGLRLG